MEMGEVEAQAVAGGSPQGPALVLVVAILPGEARRCQAPEHGLGPLRALGCGCRAPQQAQEDQQQPEGGGTGVGEGPEACPHPSPLRGRLVGGGGGGPLTSSCTHPADQAGSGASWSHL